VGITTVASTKRPLYYKDGLFFRASASTKVLVSNVISPLFSYLAARILIAVIFISPDASILILTRPRISLGSLAL